MTDAHESGQPPAAAETAVLLQDGTHADIRSAPAPEPKIEEVIATPIIEPYVETAPAAEPIIRDVIATPIIESVEEAPAASTQLPPSPQGEISFEAGAAEADAAHPERVLAELPLTVMPPEEGPHWPPEQSDLSFENAPAALGIEEESSFFDHPELRKNNLGAAHVFLINPIVELRPSALKSLSLYANRSEEAAADVAKLLPEMITAYDDGLEGALTTEVLTPLAMRGQAAAVAESFIDRIISRLYAKNASEVDRNVFLFKMLIEYGPAKLVGASSLDCLTVMWQSDNDSSHKIACDLIAKLMEKDQTFAEDLYAKMYDIALELSMSGDGKKMRRGDGWLNQLDSAHIIGLWCDGDGRHAVVAGRIIEGWLQNRPGKDLQLLILKTAIAQSQSGDSAEIEKGGDLIGLLYQYTDIDVVDPGTKPGEAVLLIGDGALRVHGGAWGDEFKCVRPIFRDWKRSAEVTHRLGFIPVRQPDADTADLVRRVRAVRPPFGLAAYLTGSRKQDPIERAIEAARAHGMFSRSLWRRVSSAKPAVA